MDVVAYMAERIPLIDAGLETRLALRSNAPETLVGAMRHLLFPGGKRLRPVLALAAAEAVGGDPKAALPMAVAVELVHTYSLIHDDLPCMDDDALRRGRPTVHVAYGEATAVLAGDALLAEAFAVVAEDGPRMATAESSLDAVARLAQAAGADGLVGGQIDDLRFDRESGASVGAEQLVTIHARKTAALFQAAIVGGAALAGASGAQRTALDDFGRSLGLAFQIADDLLDADSDEAASILRVGSEPEARRTADRLLGESLATIEGWGERAEPLAALARHAVRRDR